MKTAKVGSSIRLNFGNVTCMDFYNFLTGIMRQNLLFKRWEHWLWRLLANFRSVVSSGCDRFTGKSSSKWLHSRKLHEVYQKPVVLRWIMMVWCRCGMIRAAGSVSPSPIPIQCFPRTLACRQSRRDQSPPIPIAPSTLTNRPTIMIVSGGEKALNRTIRRTIKCSMHTLTSFLWKLKNWEIWKSIRLCLNQALKQRYRNSKHEHQFCSRKRPKTSLEKENHIQ